MLVWWLAAGSNFTSGTQNTSAFASNTSANRVSSSIVNMSSSTDNEFLLTGVQLEVGQNPTSFEHEPIERTLEKCQRYFETGVAGSVGSGNALGTGYFGETTDYKVEKRAAATLAQSTNRLGKFIVTLFI